MVFFLRLQPFFSMLRPRTPSTPTVVVADEDGMTSPNKIAAPHTTRNVLRFALETLSEVSSNIPFGEILSSVINPLLKIADRIEQTSANNKDLAELATRIGILAPIVSDMVTGNVEGCRIIETLRDQLQLIKRDLAAMIRCTEEIQSITEDLGKTKKTKKLQDFFNSAEIAAIVARHNLVLDRLITDALFVLSREHMKVVQRALLKWQASGSFDAQFKFGHITGGVGGTGGKGRIGGHGGIGEGPKLAVGAGQSWKVEKISGALLFVYATYSAVPSGSADELH
ncbi:hypothetical protein C8R43DRAFT_1045316 [Mycena crocata]|nr:hypothetical protein C8R43DRAFT_1045316 [Mycena crocata]